MNSRSLVLITVDCLRADHCGFNGYSRQTTPLLDSLTGESTVVPNAVIAGGPTYYSLPAIMCSRSPLALGRDIIGIGPGEPTVATCLHDAGYATAAFSAANPYISPRFGYDQGFEVFRDFLDCDAGTKEAAQTAPGPLSDAPARRTLLNRRIKDAASALGLSRAYDELYFQYCSRIAAASPGSLDELRRFPDASVMVDQALSWLATIGDRSFFLWIHMMDPHAPYYPLAEPYFELTGKELSPDRARYLNAFWNRGDLDTSGLARHCDEVQELYDAGIRWVDSQCARLVEQLKKSGEWENCVFALTADHGEEFLDHGGRFHAPVKLFEEIILVPLMLRVPGKQAFSVSDTPFSLLHLAPTLLATTGVPCPPEFRGRSLGDSLNSEKPVVVECVYGCKNPLDTRERIGNRLLAIRDRRYKLVARLSSPMQEELYDLESDPAERHALEPDERRDVRARLWQAAHEHLVRSSTDRDPVLRLRSQVHEVIGNLQARNEARALQEQTGS